MPNISNEISEQQTRDEHEQKRDENNIKIGLVDKTVVEGSKYQYDNIG